MKVTHNVMAGAGILALSGFIAKLFSAIYRVPFQNIVGNTGFYVYQQVYPLYGIAVVLALSGWPVFVSKIIIEQPDEVHAKAVARRLFIIFCIVGILMFAFLFFGATPMAGLLGGDKRLAPVIQAVAWLYLCMPLLSISRGYSQGYLNMLPTALSQVVEQVIRVIVILTIALVAVQGHWSVYKMGAWAMAGAPIAAVFAIVLLWRVLVAIWSGKIGKVDQLPSWWQLGRRFFREGGLITLLAMLLVLLQLMDSMTLKVALVAQGLSVETAEALKGVYDRGQPMLQLGMVLATSVSASLLPALRTYHLRQQDHEFQHDFRSALRVTVLVASATMCGMIAIMPQMNQMLFSSREGSIALAWYVVLILPATIILLLSSVLQSVDRTRGLMFWIGMALVIKYLLNSDLVAWWGVAGASIATIIAILPLMVYTIYRMPNLSWRGALPGTWVTKVVISLVMLIIFAIIGTSLGDWLLGTSRMASLVTTLLGTFAGGGVFVTLLVKFELLTPAEWLLLPKGDQIYQLLVERGK